VAVITATSTNNWASAFPSTPTAADDVVIPATFTVTVPTATTVVCRSLTVQASGGLTFASTTAVINCGDATAGLANVALSFSSTCTITLTGIGVINLISTSATQQTITTGGKTPPSININGVGSSYLMSDAMTIGTFTATNGTFDTGSFAFTPTVFQSQAGTKTMTLGSSAITCSNWTLRTSGTTVTANTATVTQSASASTFDFNSLAGVNYNGLTLIQSGAATATIGTSSSGAVTLATYTRTGTATKTNGLTLGCNLTCTGTMTINGNSDVNRMWVISDTVGTARTLTAATVSVSNIDLQDITGAGAGSWNIAACTGLSGDCQGNSGITFTTPATQTFTSGTKNWSDVTVWTSRVPLPQDDVIVNTTTATTLTADMPRMGRNIDFTTFNKTLTASAGISASIYGNLTLASGMTWTWSNTTIISLRGRGSQTITSAGQVWGTGGNFTLNMLAPGGTYTLQDALATYSAGTGGSITLSNGTFNTNTFTVTTGVINMSAATTRTWNQTNSTINLGGTATIWNATTTTGLTFTATGSTIVSTVVSATGRTIIGGGLKYGALTYTVAGSTGTLTLTGSSYFSAINFTDSTNARSLLLTSGTQTTVGTLNATGASGRLISINAVTAGTAAYLDILDTPPTLDWMSIKDIYAGIPYKFYAGANSTDVSGNTNVTFTAKPGTTGLFINRYATNTSASTSITVTFPYSLTPTVGDALVAFWHHNGNAGTVTPPAGWTAIDSINFSTTTYLKAYYKISDGTENSFTFTSTSSPATTMLYVYSIDGFTGTTTLDNTDKNSGTAITSLVTSGTPSSNTGNPAFAIAGYGIATTGGASVSFTNSFLEGRGLTQQTMLRPVMKQLTSNGAVSTTYTWTTARDATTILVVFKDVVAAGSSIKSLSALGVG